LANASTTTTTGEEGPLPESAIMSPARHLPASADDVLAPLPPERRLTLVFERISAFVSVHTVPPSLSSRLAARARDALVRRRAAAAATSAAAQAAAAAGDVEAPKQQRPALPTPLQSGDAPPEHRQILHAVSGVVLPGEVLVLMGPSGSGKTSLLSVVSGRAPRAVRTQGRVTVNGGLFTKAAKRRVGFVLQDDMLFETLTVHETLAFAAELRLPRSTTPAQRAARVEGVVAALGLAKCRDTIVGGWERRGISGGERKRVSIGHELLIDPALLLLDEPTSGLDATTALHLARTLRRLASGGRAVCSTLHQPSSRIFLQLDRLMLLADGHVLYYGAAAAAVPWFATLGFACPYGVNVADFILDLAQGEVALDKSAVGKGGARLSLGGLEGLDEGAAASYGNGGGASDGGDGGDGDEDDDDEDKGALSPPGSRRTSGVFDAAKPAGLLRRSASGEGPLRGPAAVAALWRTYESHAAAAAKAMRAAAAAAAGGGAASAASAATPSRPPPQTGPPATPPTTPPRRPAAASTRRAPRPCSRARRWPTEGLAASAPCSPACGWRTARPATTPAGTRRRARRRRRRRRRRWPRRRWRPRRTPRRRPRRGRRRRTAAAAARPLLLQPRRGASRLSPRRSRRQRRRRRRLPCPRPAARGRSWRP